MSDSTGRFRTLEKLGAGGMGVVYRVFDEDRGGEVALKRATSPGPDALYRLKREFRARAGLAHPNLVHLYELIADGEQCVFTMELVDGVPFLRWLRDEDEEQATLVGTETSSAVTVPSGSEVSEAPIGIDQVPEPAPTGSTDSELASRPTVVVEVTPVTATQASGCAEATGSSRPTIDSKNRQSPSTEPAASETVNGHLSVKDEASEAPTIISSGDDTPTSAYPVGSGSAVSTTAVAHALPLQELTPECEVRLRQGLIGLLRGLNALHEMGQAHRDIKSSNVLVTASGRVVILDFGLTSKIASYEAHSGANDLAGTPAYMAPEQLSGKGSTASDMYAVGVLLFESMVGRPPFEGKLLQVLQAKSSRPAPDPRTLNPAVPEDLATLAVDLLARDPAARPSARAALARLNPRQDSDLGMVPDPEIPGDEPGSENVVAKGLAFEGRSEELAILAEAQRKVGTLLGPSVAKLYGPSGSGKTRLVEQFLRSLPPGVLVLSSVCNRNESVPFQAVDAIVDKLAQRLRGMSKLERRAVLPRRNFALRTLFPTLCQIPEINQEATPPKLVQDGASTSDASELRQLGFRAFRELLGRFCSQAPVVLWVDDLQWCDRDSIALLLETVAAEDAPEILLVTSYREEDRDSSASLRTWDQVRLRSETFTELALPALESAETQRMIEQLAPLAPSHLVDAAVAKAAGNPFVAVELGRFLSSRREAVDELPEDVFGALIERRLSALDESTKALVETVALANAPLEPGLAVEASGGRDLSSLTVQWLCDRHLLRETSAETKAVVTYHESLRETVVASMDEDGKQRTHRRLAEALHRARPDALEDLFVHWQGAGEFAKAIRAGLEAADRASKALAFDLAARLYQLTIELLADEERTAEIYEAYATALKNSDRCRDAADNFLLAADKASSRNRNLWLRRAAAEQYLRAGYTDQGWQELKSVLDDLGIRVPQSRAAMMLGSTFRRVRFLMSKLPEVEDYGRDHGFSEEELLEVETLWSCTHSLSLLNVSLADNFRTRHLGKVLEKGSRSMISRVLTSESAMESHLGGKFFTPNSLKLVKRAQEFAAESGDPEDQAYALTGKVSYLYNQSDWEATVAAAEEGIEIFRRDCVGTEHESAAFRHFLFDSQIQLGEFGSLAKKIKEVLARAEANENIHSALSVLYPNPLVVWVARGKGEWAMKKSIEMRLELQKEGRDTPDSVYSVFAMISKVMTSYSQGDYETGYHHMVENWPLLEKHFVLKLQNPRLFLPFTRSVGALGVLNSVALADRDRKKLIREVTKAAKVIAKDERSLAQSMSELLGAGLALINDDEGLAEERIRKSLSLHQAHNKRLGVASCWRALSRLNVEGAESMRRKVDEWALQQDVTAPDDLFRVHWPF